jgi:hypothetical protein
MAPNFWPFPQIQLVRPFLGHLRNLGAHHSNYALTTLCWFLCRSVWVVEACQFFLVPSRSSNTPLYPSKVLQAKERAPTPCLTDSQLLEGLKCESKWKTTKKGGVGARSLAHNTLRGRRACWSSGMGLGRIDKLTHSHGPAHNPHKVVSA